MSAKFRLILWFTLMILLLSGMVLTFILVINEHALIDDPAERLVDVVLDNADDVEFDNGRFDWDDLDPYKHGVYCFFYDEDGALRLSAAPEGLASALPFQPNVIRTVEAADGEEYFLYDAYVDMSVTGLWIRGMIDATNHSGLMHTILVLTAILLPAILALTVGGGWLIAWDTFRPLERILRAADSISDGADLSARVDLRRGPKEMRRLSQAFDRMFSRLELAFQAERQFTSDASHELRTPITVILAQCDRSRRKDKTPEDFLSSIEIIEGQARRMSELVQQLLGLTRMQYGADRYPMKTGDLSAFVQAVCEEFRPADGRGISLETDIQPDVTARFNPSLISRVIQNLLQNAYKYGKPQGHIWLSLRREGDKAVLKVRDDGIGIASEDLDKVWQRFWQADASRGEDGGSGLGLAMVKEIAQFHGGQALVKSEPGRGSEFTVTF